MTIEFQERAIDYHFADFICKQVAGEANELFRLVVSLASNAVGQGSICMNLDDIAGAGGPGKWENDSVARVGGADGVA